MLLISCEGKREGGDQKLAPFTTKEVTKTVGKNIDVVINHRKKKEKKSPGE